MRKNILRIATGSIASQAIVLGATPLLTRIYAPEEFGALAVFAAAYAIVVGVVTLKYDLSIILPSDHDKAAELTALTLYISIVLSLVLLAFLGLGFFIFGIPERWYFFLLPVSTILGAAYTCSQQWAARNSDYRRFARSQVINSLVNVGTSLLLATFFSKIFGSLVIGFIAGLAVGLLYLSYSILLAFYGKCRAYFRWPALYTVALEFKRFPLFVLPASAMAALGTNAAPFLFQAMFSLQQVGYYAIANRFLMAPSSLLGGAVAEAFRAEFVDRHKRGQRSEPLFRNTLGKLVFVALPVFGVFFLIAPLLFSFLLGDVYRAAGVLSRYLCIGVLAQFVSQPFQYVFVATGYVRLGLLMQSAATVLPLLGAILGGLDGNMERSILFAAMLTVATSALQVLTAYRCCQLRDAALHTIVSDA